MLLAASLTAMSLVGVGDELHSTNLSQAQFSDLYLHQLIHSLQQPLLFVCPLTTRNTKEKFQNLPRVTRPGRGSTHSEPAASLQGWHISSPLVLRGTLPTHESLWVMLPFPHPPPRASLHPLVLKTICQSVSSDMFSGPIPDHLKHSFAHEPVPHFEKAEIFWIGIINNPVPTAWVIAAFPSSLEGVWHPLFLLFCCFSSTDLSSTTLLPCLENFPMGVYSPDVHSVIGLKPLMYVISQTMQKKNVGIWDVLFFVTSLSFLILMSVSPLLPIIFSLAQSPPFFLPHLSEHFSLCATFAALSSCDQIGNYISEQTPAF